MRARPTLREALAEYLALRRSLGFKLDNAGRLLGQFIDYLDEHGIDVVTVDAALAWASLPAGASVHWRAIRLSVVRGFATHLSGSDPRVQVPPAGLVRAGPCRATPYLYSPDDIAALMAAAGTLRPPLRAATYRTLIGLLVTTGARIGEAIRLDDDDYHHDDALLVVRESKFGKSRLVAFHQTTAEAVDRYRELRDQLCPRRRSPALLVSTAGTRLFHSNISLTYSRLLEQAGVTGRSASCRPRVHDLRHSAAVNTVLDAYRRGDDVGAVLPRLATALGHTDPKHTFWYLTSAPELMAIAGQRLNDHLEGQP